ncbi:MAG: hypothetical protein DMG71_09935, partial [Acidobacteria bacterium]
IAVINSAIAAYYYLRVIVVMYMREPRDDAPLAPLPAALGVALAVCLAATIYLGVLPGGVLNYTQRSAEQLVQILVSPSARDLPPEIKLRQGRR